MKRLLLLAILFTTGCDVDPFCITCEQNGDDDDDDDGGSNGDGGASDGTPTIDATAPDACLPSGVEVCNGLNDDCDGEVDELPMPGVGDDCGENVGICTTGTTECVAGEIICGGGAVLPMAESCNGEDDDCDGTPDDGDPGGGVLCGTDIGDCQRGTTMCVAGMVECVGGIVESPEACDGRDNDCDGVIDDGDPEGGMACSVSGCAPGTYHCVGGVIQCQGAGIPSIETCNGGDDDCDMLIDEDFDLMNDPNNCGMCGMSCAGLFANAVSECTMGECHIAYCLTDYWDEDMDESTGCEYACSFQGAEICNGEDDDCNDEIDEGLTPPAICNNVGACAGTVATCGGAVGWECDYPAAVSQDMDGNIVPETDCNDVDNDCDGVPDDAFTTKGMACSKGMGACKTNGVIDCNATEDGVECNAPTPPAGTTEMCNGIDDNCDGILDNGTSAMDSYVAISGGGITGTKYIARYEASRPDATTTTGGSMTHRPCMVADKQPWTNVTQPQAEAACAAAGARLCSETEWQRACQTSAGTPCTWSYASTCTTYAGSTCNGNDYDFDTGVAGDQDGLLATGALTSCYANWGSMSNRINDLSGNVKEWTLERSAGVNPLRGGSYNNTQVGISCGYNFVVADDAFQFNNVGFRCCRDTAP